MEKVVSLIFRQTRERERERSSIFHSGSLTYTCSCSPPYLRLCRQKSPQIRSLIKMGSLARSRLSKYYSTACVRTSTCSYALGQMACRIETKALSQMRGIAVKIEICLSLSTLDSPERARDRAGKEMGLDGKDLGTCFPL